MWSTAAWTGLEAFHRGTTARQRLQRVRNKKLPTTGTWPAARHVTSPLRHIWRVGWSVCIVHKTTQGSWGDGCEVKMCHRGIMDQLVVHRLTEPLRISLSVCLYFCLQSLCGFNFSSRERPDLVFSCFFFFNPSCCLSLKSKVLFFCRRFLSFFHSASILFLSLPSTLPLTSPESLRCASSCVAPSDPTARNTCNQRQRNREQLVSSLPMQGEEVCFVDWAKCCC